MIETNVITTRAVVRSNLHSALMTSGSIWNIKFFPNLVGKIAKTSSLSATDGKQRFFSSFSSVIGIQSISESHRAFSKSPSVNRSREDAMFIALRHDMQIRRQNGFVNQTRQQSMISLNGDCTRI